MLGSHTWCKHQTKACFGPVVCWSLAAQFGLLSGRSETPITPWDGASPCPLQGCELWRCKRREEAPVLPTLGHLLRAANCSFNPFSVFMVLIRYKTRPLPRTLYGINWYGKCPYHQYPPSRPLFAVPASDSLSQDCK